MADVINRFIEFYGWNGIVNVQNVTDFLASISMSPKFLSRLPRGNDAPCPSIPMSSTITWTQANATSLASLVLDAVQTPACYDGPMFQSDDEHKHKDEPNPLQVWGYGLLCVTLINMCALVGIFFLPCIGRRVYKLLMAFMVSLAVGSLLATALLVLLPESLQLLFIFEEVNKANSSLIHDHHHHLFHAEHDHTSWKDFLSTHPWYLWRSCTVLGGVYLFFLIERMLKELIRWKGGSAGHGHSHLLPPSSSVPSVSPSDATTDLANFRTTEVKLESATAKPDSEAPADPESEATTAAYGTAVVLPPRSGGCCGDGFSRRWAVVKPVAWMILIGDALHNFVDGLSIGAAFTRSTLSGVSICLAVLCEELPHELGDFAILLSAGMSMPMALLCNFLSACTCYLGFALGVLIGETGASVWVFAIATGMFLYISLVDMMPEVSHSMEEPEAEQLGRKKIFLLQNLGLFMGYSAVLLLALYGSHIRVG